MSKKALKVLLVSAEVAPFAKTGGLADVAAALPKALSAMGHDVRIVMPKYRIVGDINNYVADFGVSVGNRIETIVVHEQYLPLFTGSETKGVKVYMLGNANYFDRDGIYGHEDDGERFALLCKASLELIDAIDFVPDIIHCNDWHTGPLPMLLKELYLENSKYKNIKTLFTIHNMEYQGHFNKTLLNFMGLNQDIFTSELVEFYGTLNFMKAGLIYSDKINTVSRTYAKEIATAEFGERLDGLVRQRENDICGIVNGIDTDIFNPETDIHLQFNFDDKGIEKKTINKWQLQKELGLNEGDFPLAAMVSRLASQKGLDIVLEALPKLINKGLQFVLLGLGEPFFEEKFKELSTLYPQMVYCSNSFNPPLAQRIYGSCDLFLMPSKFEPCGLGQLIAMRYGGIPVVRETGGLADTVKDFASSDGDGNGFVFTESSSEAFSYAVERAMILYKSSKKDFFSLQSSNMKMDYSWRKSAIEYEELYFKIIES